MVSNTQVQRPVHVRPESFARPCVPSELVAPLACTFSQLVIPAHAVILARSSGAITCPAVRRVLVKGLYIYPQAWRRGEVQQMEQPYLESSVVRFRVYIIPTGSCCEVYCTSCSSFGTSSRVACMSFCKRPSDACGSFRVRAETGTIINATQHQHEHNTTATGTTTAQQRPQQQQQHHIHHASTRHTFASTP